jgi:hypothetical protein
VEYLVYNWRILFGGVASASILTVGLAAPALAQTVSRAGSPTSSVSGITQELGGTGAATLLCALPSLPTGSLGVSAAAGILGAPCGTSAGSSTSNHTQVTSASTPNASSAASGLSSVSGAIPDLSKATSVVPSLSSMTGPVSGHTSDNGTSFGLGAVTAVTVATGVTGGIANISSLTNGLPDTSTVTGALGRLGG